MFYFYATVPHDTHFKLLLSVSILVLPEKLTNPVLLQATWKCKLSHSPLTDIEGWQEWGSATAECRVIRYRLKPEVAFNAQTHCSLVPQKLCLQIILH